MFLSGISKMRLNRCVDGKQYIKTNGIMKNSNTLSKDISVYNVCVFCEFTR